MSAADESTMRMSTGVPAAAMVRPATTIDSFRCARTIVPPLDDFDEIGSSKTNSSVESNGRTFPGGGADSDGVGFGMGVGGIGYAPAVPTPTAANARTMRLRLVPSREDELARALSVRRGALSLFDELLDFLPTLLSYAFVEVRPIAVSRGFAAFLATLLANLLVKLVSVGLFRCQAALAADLFVELSAVLSFNGLAAFLAGFSDRHSAAAPVRFRNHLVRFTCFLYAARKGRQSLLHLLQRRWRVESLPPKFGQDEKRSARGGK